jgi:hypothetical protein
LARVQGQEAPRGGIVFWGAEKNKNYIADIAFGGLCIERYCGRVWLWNVGRLARKMVPQVSLQILELHRRLRWMAGRGGSLFIPCWVGGAVTLTATSARPTDGQRSDLRKIKKHRMQCDVTTDEARIEDFYHTMYVPYIRRMYGNKALLMPHNEMIRKIEKCKLLLLKRGNRTN